MNANLTYLLVSFAILFHCCTPNPNSYEAMMMEPQEMVEVDQNSEIYNFVERNSRVNWIGTKPTGRHHGFIPISAGQLFIEDEHICGGKITFDLMGIDVEDLDKASDDYKKLLNHLKSSDFFDVMRYENAYFEITDVETLNDADIKISNVQEEFAIKNPTHRITGNLIIKNISKGIAFPAHITFENSNVQVEAKFNINRTLWGITYSQESKFVDRAKDGLIYDLVNIGFDIDAKLIRAQDNPDI